MALLAQQLPSATPDQARMLLGEALYPMVDEIEPASAAKITGMLLEMDQGEVLLLIEDNGALPRQGAGGARRAQGGGGGGGQLSSRLRGTHRGSTGNPESGIGIGISNHTTWGLGEVRAVRFSFSGRKSDGRTRPTGVGELRRGGEASMLFEDIGASPPRVGALCRRSAWGHTSTHFGGARVFRPFARRRN